MINIIDNYKYSRFLGAYVQTARKSLANVAVFCTADAGPTLNRETFVIAMSRNSGMDYADLGTRRGEREFKGSLLSDANVEEAIRRCQFGDPWYRRRYLTKEQEADAIDEATKRWEREQRTLSDELEQLTREAKSSKPDEKKRVTEAKRRLREHKATKRRQIENNVRDYAQRPDELAPDQLARIEEDLRKLPELILTDDYAPVENLLAPVARERDL
jgi:hypothetical protein